MPVALSLIRTSVGPRVLLDTASWRLPHAHRAHTGLRRVNLLDFYMEVWAFVDYYTTLALLWDIESLNLFFGHGDVCMKCMN